MINNKIIIACFLCMYSFAQEKIQVKGNIKDSNGEAAIQATVKEKEGTAITVTDIEGNYLITVPKDAILEISYIGIKKEVKVNGSKILDITLDLSEELEDVVVTGFQKISKDRASGSFESMSKNVLDVRASQDVSSILQGQMAGVDVSKDNKITIRGISSFGNTSPLIVVDGFPVSGGIESINPNNIESVNVLKDAASASIWGARSANGVIVITTKSAKETEKEEKMLVNFHVFTRIGERVDLDYANPIANSAKQLEIEKYLAEEYYKFSPATVYTPDQLFSDNASRNRTQGMYIYSMLSRGYLQNSSVADKLEELRNINYQDDVNKYLLRNPLYQQYNLSIRGNTKKNNYSFSAMYDDDKTFSIGSGSNRFILDFKNTFKYNKYISLMVSLYSQFRDSKSNGASIAEIKGMSAYDKLVNSDGTYANTTSDINYGMREYMDLYYQFPYSWRYNLLEETRNRDIKQENIQNRFQIGIDLNIVEGLKIASKFQYQKNSTSSRSFYDERTYEVRKRTNTFSEVVKGTDSVINVYYPKGGMIRGESYISTNSYNFRNQLDYSKIFNDIHDINIIAGTEIISNVSQGTYLPDIFGVYTYTNSTAILPDMSDRHIDYTGNNAAGMAHKRATTYSYNDIRYFSLYLNSSYTFDRRYTVTFSVRTDASNIISDNPAYRYAPLWSSGVNWNVMKEHFMEGIHYLDRLNVRGSYGINANAASSTSNVTTISTNSGYIANEYNQITSLNYGNPNLKWEKTESYNIGIDYSLLKSLLYGNIDVYNRKGIDLLYARQMPATLGFSNSLQSNYANVLNRGIEIKIGTRVPILNNDITITTDVNYSYNYNKITDIDEINVSVVSNRGTTTRYFKGGSVDDYYAFKYSGYQNGIPYLIKNDGTFHSMNVSIPSQNNKEAMLLYNMGTTIAPVTWGWTNTIKVYDLSVTTIITGRNGHIFSRYPVYSGSIVGTSYNYYKDFDNYLNNPGATDYPGVINHTNMGLLMQRGNYTSHLSSNVDNAAFIRFNDLILNYDITKYCRDNEYLSFINKLNLYMQVRNVALIWAANKWGIDPEYIEGTLRPIRTYTFGLRIDI